MTFLTQGAMDLSIQDYQPKRFGLQFDPTVIVVEYIVPSTGKLYHHNMKLRNLKKRDDPNSWIDYLYKKHSLYLSDGKVDRDQIYTLIMRLQDNLRNVTVKDPYPPNNYSKFMYSQSDKYSSEQESEEDIVL